MNSIIPIEHSAKAMEHKGTVRYYIRHIFNALREHQELLTQYTAISVCTTRQSTIFSLRRRKTRLASKRQRTLL